MSDGFVVLEGNVENFAEKDDAAHAVRDLAGVIAVDDRSSSSSTSEVWRRASGGGC